MIKKRGIILLLLILLIIIPFAFSAESENYKIEAVEISSGSDSMSSSNYKSIIVIDHSSDTETSPNYKTGLGFTYTIYEPPASTPSTTEETSSSGGGSAGGGGAGGAIIPKKELSFSVEKDLITSELVIGTTTTKIIEIKNTGEQEIEGIIEITGVKDFVLLSDYTFSLDVGEKKQIELNIVAKELGLFTGKIVLKVNNIKEEIPIIIKVETENVLFDTKIDIPQEQSKVVSGDELETQVSLISMGLPKKVDVFITYEIKDLNGNTVLKETETVAVEKQLTFTKKFQLPKYLDPGDYILGMEVLYEGALAIGGELFTVVDEKEKAELKLTKTQAVLLLITIIFIAISILIYNFFIIKKK